MDRERPGTTAWRSPDPESLQALRRVLLAVRLEGAALAGAARCAAAVDLEAAGMRPALQAVRRLR